MIDTRFGSGSKHHKIVVEGVHKERIELDENTEGNLMIFVEGTGSIDLTVHARKNCSWTYLWVNQSSQTLDVNEVIILDENSHLKVNYGELSTGNHQKNTEFILQGERSSVVMRSATLAFGNLKWKVTANHQARYTEAHLNSYGIVLQDGMLEFEVIGSIANGNSGSKTHQLTRIMNLGDELKTTVYPKLLIEENDVEASHAASVGQPDEDQVYYMQSRGLTRLDALKLITLGYLLPIVYEVEDEVIRERLKEEIEAKVEEEWTQ